MSDPRIETIREALTHLTDFVAAEAALDSLEADLTKMQEEDVTETLQSQIDRLARFIMEEVPGEPSQSEGAVDTAIRIMRTALSTEEPE